MEMLNHHPTKDLTQFQKLVINGIYIRQLNKWLDELEFENEKKDAIIQMKENEIAELQKEKSDQSIQFLKLKNEFKEYTRSIKSAKVDSEKSDKQQLIIKELRTELDSIKRRLSVSHRMNELLTKQK